MGKKALILEQLEVVARRNPKRIVLAEGIDERVLTAASRAAAEGIARITVLGPVPEIRAKAERQGLKLDGMEIVDPLTSDRQEAYADRFFQIRSQRRPITREEARERIKHIAYFAAAMVSAGDAEGMVGGAVLTTREVALASLGCLGLAPGISTMSSAFLMAVPDCPYGEKGAFIFADCGVIPEPTPNQFVEIALGASQLARFLLQAEPRVAFLSYSTKGSAPVRVAAGYAEAMAVLRQKAPDLKMDGELQADAALVPGVAERKIPGSLLQGRANVLIFPDLNAGNLAYKLVQRLARAEAVGPILLGLNHPASDLSRGADSEEIFNAIVVTVVRAQKGGV